jgi:VWFA-related protein
MKDRAAWAGTAGMALLLAAAAAAQQPARQAAKPLPQVPLIRASTTLVEVPVLVLNKQGRPLQTLSRDDFRLYDDGAPQRITGFDRSARPISLAIVVDTSDYDAIGQARRAAQLICQMVVGAQGQASVFIPGPEPKQILPFTSDTNRIATTLSHLSKSPTPPQGYGSIVEPLNLAMLDLRQQPDSRTRAALVISRSNAKGPGAEALLESGMSDAIPIFHISPNRPAGMPRYVNPDSTEQRGTGVGSQRVQAPPAPTDMHGQPTSGYGAGNLDLAPIIGAAAGLAGKLLDPHHLDYVYNSGGVSYSAGNDRDFDAKLSLIGDELRSIYHLYYSPNNLTDVATIHSINVKLDLPPTSGVGSTNFRRTYVGIKPH